MKRYKALITKSLSEALSMNFYDVEKLISIPPSLKMGDYAFPCFILCPSLKRPPHVIACEIKDRIKIDGIGHVEAVGPYLNFFIDRRRIFRDIIECKRAHKCISQHNSIVLYNHKNIWPLYHKYNLELFNIEEQLNRLFEFQGYRVFKEKQIIYDDTDYEYILKKISERMKVINDGGTMYVELHKENLPPFILSVYGEKYREGLYDLYNIFKIKEKYNPDKFIFISDGEREIYFKQLSIILERLGLMEECDFHYIDYNKKYMSFLSIYDKYELYRYIVSELKKEDVLKFKKEDCHVELGLNYEISFCDEEEELMMKIVKFKAVLEKCENEMNLLYLKNYMLELIKSMGKCSHLYKKHLERRYETALLLKSAYDVIDTAFMIFGIRGFSKR